VGFKIQTSQPNQIKPNQASHGTTLPALMLVYHYRNLIQWSVSATEHHSLIEMNS